MFLTKTDHHRYNIFSKNFLRYGNYILEKSYLALNYKSTRNKGYKYIIKLKIFDPTYILK